MKRNKDKIIDHFLLGPFGFRYRTSIVLIIAVVINIIFFPTKAYVFFIIMAFYVVFGLTGIERKLIIKWRNEK